MKLKGQFSYQNLEVSALSLGIVDILACGVSGCIPTQTLFAGLYELFGPLVEVGGPDAFATTQFVDGDLALKASQYYVDLLFRGVFPASRWSDLTNESYGALAPLFCVAVLIFYVLCHCCSFQGDRMSPGKELALPAENLC